MLTLFGLLATIQITMAMDSDLLSSTTTATSTQPLNIQSGRTKRSQRSLSSPPSTLHQSISVSPIDDYDLTRTPNSSSSSSSQPNSPREQIDNNPQQNQQKTTKNILTGHYANELNAYTRTLPIHRLINSVTQNNIDGISYKNNQTNKLETILFHSDVEYKKERYIIVFNNSENENWISNASNENFILEITPDDATKTEETAQDTLLRQKSIETLKKLKNSYSSSSNSSNSDTEKKQETSITENNIQPSQVDVDQEQEIKNTKSIPDNNRSFQRTFMRVSFIAICIAFAYKYNNAFSQYIDNFCAQCKNFIPSNFAR